MPNNATTPEQLGSMATLLLATERKLPDAARAQMTNVTNMALGIAMSKAPFEVALFVFNVATTAARALSADASGAECAGILAASAASWRKAPAPIRAGVERVRVVFNARQGN